MDNRYPNLKPLDHLPVDPSRKARIIAACNEVCRRTAVGCCYNAVSRCLFFYRRDCSQGIAGLPWEEVRVPIIADKGIDTERLVREIQETQRPMADKLAEIERSNREAECAAEEAEAKRLDDLDGEALALLRHMGRGFNMGSHFRPSVVVDGIKATERPSGLLVAEGV